MNTEVKVQRVPELLDRSPLAPAQLAAYAVGATLWAPALVYIARFSEPAFALIPGFQPAPTLRILAFVWIARFALYVMAAQGNWNYGYGVNGVIINRTLPLTDKLRRIATDWFAIVLMLVCVWFVAGMLLAR